MSFIFSNSSFFKVKITYDHRTV
ncbi:hypothetical protein EMIT0347P_30689 [Pseudomonas sp. IT-347P]